MVERLGGKRKGKRERIEKGSREGIQKIERDKKTQFEEKEGLRDPPFFKDFIDPPLFLQVLRV